MGQDGILRRVARPALLRLTENPAEMETRAAGVRPAAGDATPAQAGTRPAAVGLNARTARRPPRNPVEARSCGERELDNVVPKLRAPRRSAILRNCWPSEQKRWSDGSRRRTCGNLGRGWIGLAAVALFGLIAGMGAVPCARAQAQAAQSKWKDQAEYDLYTQAGKNILAKNFAQAIANLDTWKKKYPDSAYKNERSISYMQAYAGDKQFAKAVDEAGTLLAGDLNATFSDPAGGSRPGDHGSLYNRELDRGGCECNARGTGDRQEGRSIVIRLQPQAAGGDGRSVEPGPH